MTFIHDVKAQSWTEEILSKAEEKKKEKNTECQLLFFSLKKFVPPPLFYEQ